MLQQHVGNQLFRPRETRQNMRQVSLRVIALGQVRLSQAKSAFAIVKDLTNHLHIYDVWPHQIPPSHPPNQLPTVPMHRLAAAKEKAMGTAMCYTQATGRVPVKRAHIKRDAICYTLAIERLRPLVKRDPQCAASRVAQWRARRRANALAAPFARAPSATHASSSSRRECRSCSDCAISNNSSFVN